MPCPGRNRVCRWTLSIRAAHSTSQIWLTAHPLLLQGLRGRRGLVSTPAPAPALCPFQQRESAVRQQAKSSNSPEQQQVSI